MKIFIILIFFYCPFVLGSEDTRLHLCLTQSIQEKLESVEFLNNTIYLEKFRPEPAMGQLLDRKKALEIADYLSMILQDSIKNQQCSLLTKSEKEICLQANVWDNTATKCLKWFLVPTTAALACNYFSLVPSAPVAATLTTLLGAASLTSYFSTGFIPHWASEAANKSQNKTLEISRIFIGIAKELNLILQDKTDPNYTLALEIITRMDDEYINKLNAKMKEEDSIGYNDKLFEPFRIVRQNLLFPNKDNPVVDLYGVLVK